MTHLHSHHRSHAVQQRAPAFPPHAHLVNASVSSLDFRSSALIPTIPTHYPKHSGGSPLVVDGEVITSITSAIKPKRNRLRRAIDDPYWILMTLTVAIGVTITTTVLYGVIEIIVTTGAWLHANGPTIGTIGAIIALIILAIICGGAKADKCAGIHCGGCRR